MNDRISRPPNQPRKLVEEVHTDPRSLFYSLCCLLKQFLPRAENRMRDNMRSWAIPATLIGALVLSGCQTTKEVGSPTGPVIYAKASMTGASAMADFESCGKVAQNAPYERLQSTGAGGGLIGAITAAAITGVINGMRRAEARRKAWNGCLTARSYEKVEVPDDIADAFEDADTDEQRAAIIDDWVASPSYIPIADWFEADRTATAEAYRNYLDSYPTGEFRYQALTRAALRDNRVVPLSEVRENSTLAVVIPDLFGIKRTGWTRAGVNNDGPLDCGPDVEAVANLTVSKGAISGRLSSSSFGRPVVFNGELGVDGTVTLSSNWPHEDPFRFEGTYNDAGLVEGRLRGTSSEGCDQPLWFEAFVERSVPEQFATDQLANAKPAPRSSAPQTTSDNAHEITSSRSETPETLKPETLEPEAVEPAPDQVATPTLEPAPSAPSADIPEVAAQRDFPSSDEPGFTATETRRRSHLRTWSGEATGDGVRTEYGRIFCTSTKPNRIEIKSLEDGTFSGTMVRSWDGEAARISGTINGGVLEGRLVLPTSFVDYVISGRVRDGILTGTIFSPTIQSCSATFVAMSPNGSISDAEIHASGTPTLAEQVAASDTGDWVLPGSANQDAPNDSLSDVALWNGSGIIPAGATSIGCVEEEEFELTLAIDGDRFSGQLVTQGPSEIRHAFQGSITDGRLSAREEDADEGFFSFTATIEGTTLHGGIVHATDAGHCSIKVSASKVDSKDAASFVARINHEQTTQPIENSEWRGNVVGDGARGEFSGLRIFCSSTEPAIISFTFKEEDKFSATFTSPTSEETVQVSGAVSGTRLQGKAFGTGYDIAEFVFTGSLAGNQISGKIFSPKWLLCSSTVRVERVG